MTLQEKWESLQLELTNLNKEISNELQVAAEDFTKYFYEKDYFITYFNDYIRLTKISTIEPYVSNKFCGVKITGENFVLNRTAFIHTPNDNFSINHDDLKDIKFLKKLQYDALLVHFKELQKNFKNTQKALANLIEIL